MFHGGVSVMIHTLMQHWRVCVIACMCVSLVACGSSRQLIYVRTGNVGTNQEIDDARCVLSDGKNRQWVVERTPGKAIVERGGGNITVVCQRPGFEDAVVQIDSSISAVTLGNAAIVTAVGGGFVAGAGLATGSLLGRSFSYPTRVNIAMSEGVGQQSVARPSTEFNLREQARRLNISRSCLDQLGPYDEYISPLGPGAENCR